MSNRYNILISTTIVLLFGLLSIKYQNIIGGIAHMYMPICLIILLYNLNQENFNSKISVAFGLIILNEVLIRFLGDISLNSDGNPWTSLFFLFMLLSSYITIIFITIIKRKALENFINKIVYITIAFLIIAIPYVFIFLI